MVAKHFPEQLHSCDRWTETSCDWICCRDCSVLEPAHSHQPFWSADMSLYLVKMSSCYEVLELSTWPLFCPRVSSQMEEVSESRLLPQPGLGRCPWCWRPLLALWSGWVCQKDVKTSNYHRRLTCPPSSDIGLRLPCNYGSPFGNQNSPRRRQCLKTESIKPGQEQRDWGLCCTCTESRHTRLWKKRYLIDIKFGSITYSFGSSAGFWDVSQWAPKCQPFPACAFESTFRNL